MYVHGLESGPEGRKAKELAAAGFSVVAVQMPCSDLGPSPLPSRVAEAFEASIAVQVAALSENSVDVLVGSSFGGAVTLALLQRGHWAGRTVLLCPAHELIAEKSGRSAPPGLSALDAEHQRHILVVHGSHDETVPFAHSTALVAGSAVRMLAVTDDHRLSATANAENLAVWVAATAG